MKFCPIVPSKFINAFGDFNHHLLLPHLINKGNYYTQVYASLDHTKYLDNGFFENGIATGIDELIEKAKLVKATHIIIPDSFFDKDRKHNKRYYKDYANMIKGAGFNSIAVVTAKTYENSIRALSFFNACHEIDMVAVPGQLLTRHTNIPRIKFLHHALKRVNMITPIHLLGLDNIKELDLKKYEWIHSIDSTLPFKLGYYDRRLPIKPKRDIKRPAHYFKIEYLNDDKNKSVIYNFNWIQNVLTQRL